MYIYMILLYYSDAPGEQVDHLARGGRGWELDAGPADAGAGGQQSGGQPGQVRNIKHTSNLVRWGRKYTGTLSSQLYSDRISLMMIFRVGRDTINSSQDLKMKSEMPKSLAAIEKASDFLMEASSSLKSDPYSQVEISVIMLLSNHQ